MSYKYDPNKHIIKANPNADPRWPTKNVGHEVLSYPQDYVGFERIMTCPPALADLILKQIGYETNSYGLDNKLAVRVDNPNHWVIDEDAEGHRPLVCLADRFRWNPDCRMFLYKHDFTIYFLAWRPINEEN